MGKKTIEGYLKSMLPDMNSLRQKVQACAAKHPEMFVDVEKTNYQVTGLTFSVSFDRNKDTGKITLLCMDAWLGHAHFPHAKMNVDFKGNVITEESDA